MNLTASDAIAKNNGEVEKLKKYFIKQNQYVASLELELEREKKAAKQQRSDIQELQESLDELEQYSRKNFVKIKGLPLCKNLWTFSFFSICC